MWKSLQYRWSSFSPKRSPCDSDIKVGYLKATVVVNSNFKCTKFWHFSEGCWAEWKFRSWPVFLLLSWLFNEHLRRLERLVSQVEGGWNVDPTVVTIPHHHPLLQIPAENVKYCENQKEKNWILEVLLCLFQWMAGCSPFGSFFPSMSVSPTCGSGKNSDLSVLENESVGSILLQIERQTHAEELLVKFVPFHLVKDWLIMCIYVIFFFLEGNSLHNLSKYSFVMWFSENEKSQIRWWCTLSNYWHPLCRRTQQSWDCDGSNWDIFCTSLVLCAVKFDTFNTCKIWHTTCSCKKSCKIWHLPT